MAQHVIVSNSSETQGKLLREMLLSKCLHVSLCNNFWQALQLLMDQQPDLVILDKHTPEPSPQEMCEKCLQHRPGIPIIMFGHEWCPFEVREYARYGVLDVIGGPLETESLMAHVNAALLFSNPVFANNMPRLPGQL